MRSPSALTVLLAAALLAGACTTSTGATTGPRNATSAQLLDADKALALDAVARL
jgi:hypothetical protein